MTRTQAFNAQKRATLEGKGVLNNRISEFIMEHLNRMGVPDPFHPPPELCGEQLVREVEIIPLEVVVRNVAAGSIATRFWHS